MKSIPVDQGVEYYHVHHCACGAEVFHDGATAVCEQSYEEFQCSDCRPYLFEDLLIRGQVAPISRNLLETIGTLAIGWLCGLVTCLTAWLVFR